MATSNTRTPKNRAKSATPAEMRKLSTRNQAMETALADVDSRLRRAIGVLLTVADGLENCSRNDATGAHPQDLVAGVADLFESIADRVDGFARGRAQLSPAPAART